MEDIRHFTTDSDTMEDDGKGVWRDFEVLSPEYNDALEEMKESEYGHMRKGVYLDHGGATIYPKSLVTSFSASMLTNLLGNPHSENLPARESGDMVDRVREQTLRFLGADPEHYDLVFVANATAAIKLVADCFRDLGEKSLAGAGVNGGRKGFWYGYHKDAHTSLVGVREVAGRGGVCFESDEALENWILNPHHPSHPPASALSLLSYPAQSNMTGRRLPTTPWLRQIRNTYPNTYTLLDAAAYAMTAPLGPIFADPEAAPDFTCLSFYKIFGFPDMGGLVVRKNSGHILTLRKYFGGGTVTMVSVLGGEWHKSKGLQGIRAGGGGEVDVDDKEAAQKMVDRTRVVLQTRETKPNGTACSTGACPYPTQMSAPPAAGHHGYSLHDGLEDGTLPFHSILALGLAVSLHRRLYGNMKLVSRHTSALIRRLYLAMSSLHYENGQPVVEIYGQQHNRNYLSGPSVGNPALHGATLAFNILRPDGTYYPYSAVEAAANAQNFFVRSGGVCCPGGLFTALEYEPWQLLRAMSAGHSCGADGIDVIGARPTGIVRVSLGGMSGVGDVDGFVDFLREEFVERGMNVGAHVGRVEVGVTRGDTDLGMGASDGVFGGIREGRGTGRGRGRMVVESATAAAMVHSDMLARGQGHDGHDGDDEEHIASRHHKHHHHHNNDYPLAPTAAPPTPPSETTSSPSSPTVISVELRPGPTTQVPIAPSNSMSPRVAAGRTTSIQLHPSNPVTNTSVPTPVGSMGSDLSINGSGGGGAFQQFYSQLQHQTQRQEQQYPQSQPQAQAQQSQKLHVTQLGEPDTDNENWPYNPLYHRHRGSQASQDHETQQQQTEQQQSQGQKREQRGRSAGGTRGRGMRGSTTTNSSVVSLPLRERGPGAVVGGGGTMSMMTGGSGVDVPGSGMGEKKQSRSKIFKGFQFRKGSAAAVNGEGIMDGVQGV